MRRIAWMFLLAGIPLLADDVPNANGANQGGPAIAKRNLSEAEIQSTLQALGITPGSASTGIGCDIENLQGIVTNIVKRANYPLGPVYWLRYSPRKTMTKQVRLVVTPLFTGSPLSTQVQVYSPNSASDVLAPFAIPFWAQNLTVGPWLLVVQNDAGQTASFNFSVQ